MGRRKVTEKITYRTLKAEIRALLDRPGVVEDAEERLLRWIGSRANNMTPKEAVEQLDALTGDDQESEHEQAEDILLDFLSANGFEDVGDAFLRAKERVDFWYA